MNGVIYLFFFFFFQAEDGIRDGRVNGVQTCALPILENQGAAGENFIGTCVAMDGVPFELGDPPFTGTFLPTGDISNFNSGIDPNGTWMLLASDRSEERRVGKECRSWRVREVYKQKVE